MLRVNDTLDPESQYTPEELVDRVLILGDCVNISNFSSVTYVDKRTSKKSYGFFIKPKGSSFPFEKGIVLTNGFADDIGNSKTPVLSSSLLGAVGDIDLEKALNRTPTVDATSFTFHFTPLTTNISFRYIMASEEYNNFYECLYADSFAFLLRPAGSSEAYTNLAVIPNTALPVSTMGIHPKIKKGSTAGDEGCKSVNSKYFEGYNLGDTNYGGRTVVLTAKANVVPGQTYEIKLVIADHVDENFDSAVFLEAYSFDLGADLGTSKLVATGNAVCGGVFELDALIMAPMYKWFKDGVEIVGETNQKYQANLGNGTYSVEAILSLDCIATDDIRLEFVQAPRAVKPSDIVEYGTIENAIQPFDLSQQSAVVEDGQTNVTTTYYLSEADAEIGAIESSIHSFKGEKTIVYARVEVNGNESCYVITSFEIQILELIFPKFFTPNNDGLNDTWKIQGVYNQFDASSTILIFDRFGKLLSEFGVLSDGWDGYYGGELLPPSDYWYLVKLVDNDGGVTEKKGHFSLLLPN